MDGFVRIRRAARETRGGGRLQPALPDGGGRAEPPLNDLWSELQNELPRYLAGEEPATRRLFEGIAAQLRPFFAARQGSAAAADDLTQATLLKIHFARDRYDPALPLKAWVFTIARRTLIDHLRGGAATLMQPLAQDEGGLRAEELEPLSPTLDPALQAELQRDLHRALATLKPDDRTIVCLYAVEGFSMAEIAERLGMTEGAVKVRAHRSYQQLRKLLLGLLLASSWLAGREL